MAEELARFQNFAKLKDTEIAFNDITVLAGKPGTGKSYVMKFMYAVDEILLKKNYSISNVENRIIMKKEKENLKNMLVILLANNNKNDYSILEKLLKEEEFEKFKHHFLKTGNYTDTVKAILNNSISNINKSQEFASKEKVEKLLNDRIKSVFINFNQISDNFEIQHNNLNINNNNNILSIDSEEIQINNKENVVFVETPLILEFKSFMNRAKGKIPYHIESLLSILEADYSSTSKEQDSLIENFNKKSNTVIDGDIKNRNGSFIFSRNNDKDYNIFNASSGTKSIGLLQYLVTNKALKKGSVLYWEEPEVHLHPEWQLRMIELFIELMNAGVKIVFSTHSPYMCDYLNAISKKQKFNDRVSFNLFKESSGIVENHILENQKDWNKIQAELLDPLEEIMWEYV